MKTFCKIQHIIIKSTLFLGILGLQNLLYGQLWKPAWFPATAIYYQDNVAIGSSIADKKLVVHADNQDGIKIQAAGIPRLDLHGFGIGNTSSEYAIFTDPDNGDFGIHDDKARLRRFTISKHGYIGIGTGNPESILDVRGRRIQLKEDVTGHWIAMRTEGSAVDLSFGGANLFVTPKHAGEKIFLDPFKRSGVTIGTQILPVGYSLAVDGKIIAEEIRVDISENWPDYVFAKEYQLMPLKDLRDYVEAYKHLPGIPTAKEMENNGLPVGEMQRKLVEKVEELTLYLLQQQEIIEQQQMAIEALNTELK